MLLSLRPDKTSRAVKWESTIRLPLAHAATRSQTSRQTPQTIHGDDEKTHLRSCHNTFFDPSPWADSEMSMQIEHRICIPTGPGAASRLPERPGDLFPESGPAAEAEDIQTPPPGPREDLGRPRHGG